MDIKDLTGLSKPLTKLIEVVSNGIGTIYKPKAMRKEADAEAYQIEVKAKAEAKKILIEGEAKIEVLERAKERLVYQEITRQTNIEEIAEKSIKYLPEQVSQDEVDADWRTRFFNKAQDISNNEMQEIWAKILSGEVSNPGQIRLRTLDTLSNLTRYEAKLFQKLCNLSTTKSHVWKILGNNSFENFGITYSGLMRMREAGLIHESDTLIKKINLGSKFGIVQIGMSTFKIFTQDIETQKELRLPQIAFTNAGKEICRITEPIINKDYRKELIESWKTREYDIEIMHDRD